MNNVFNLLQHVYVSHERCGDSVGNFVLSIGLTVMLHVGVSAEHRK